MLAATAQADHEVMGRSDVLKSLKPEALRRREVRRDHGQGHPGRARQARPRSAPRLQGGALQRRRRGHQGPAARHAARRHRQQRRAVRRVRRPRRPPGRPGAREPAVQQVRQRRARGGQDRRHRQGQGGGGRPGAPAHRAHDEARRAAAAQGRAPAPTTATARRPATSARGGRPARRRRRPARRRGKARWPRPSPSCRARADGAQAVTRRRNARVTELRYGRASRYPSRSCIHAHRPDALPRRRRRPRRLRLQARRRARRPAPRRPAVRLARRQADRVLLRPHQGGRRHADAVGHQRRHGHRHRSRAAAPRWTCT